jgi:hypothetical protein
LPRPLIADMKKTANKQVLDRAYKTLLSEVVLVDAARRTSGRAVNHVITSTYWEIGRRIIEHEQKDHAEPNTASNG